MPSTRPSGAVAVTTRPSPTRSMPWWWCEWISAARSPRISRSCPPEMSTSWRPNVAQPGPVRRAVGDVADVLLQVAAVRDVEQLEAAADTEHRQVAGDRAAGERQLGPIAADVRRIGRGVRLGPVVRRPDVLAADQDQPVEDLEHAGRVVGRVIGVGRQQQRDAAGRVHALDVALRNHAGGHVGPRAPARPAPVGADADARTHAYIRSKERCSSQSVTALSNACCSWRAALR